MTKVNSLKKSLKRLAINSFGIMLIGAVQIAYGDPLSDKMPDLELLESYISQGHYHKAEKLLSEHDANSSTISPLQQYQLKLNQGRLYTFYTPCEGKQAQYKKKAKQLLSSSLKWATQNQQLEMQASALLYLGLLSVTQRNYEEADDLFKQSTLLAKDNVLAANSLLHRIQTHKKLGTSDKIDELLKRLTNKLKTLPDSLEKARLLIRFANANTSTQEAFTALKQAESIAQKYQTSNDHINLQANRILSQVYGYMARLYSQQQQIEEALSLTNKAIFLAENASEWSFRWFYQKGRLLKAQNQTAKALVYYEQAYHALSNTLRLDMSAVYHAVGHKSFYESFEYLYLDLAELYIKQARKENDSSLLFKARDVIENLKKFELTDYYDDPCVIQFNTQKHNIEDLLNNTTAVLYPVLLENHLELLLTLKHENTQHAQAVSVLVSRKTIKQQAVKFREALQQHRSKAYQAYAEQFYRWLIEPVRHWLNSDINTLVVVPEGPLRTIPFAALFDIKDDKFLIEQYALAITPSLELTLPKKQHLQPDAISVLLGASKQKNLNYAMDEINDIAQAYQVKTVQLDGKENALLSITRSKILETEPFLKAHLSHLLSKQHTMIHLASHAIFSSNPQLSYIETYDKRMWFDELEDLLKNTRYHPEPVELLVLSACQTAKGDDEKAALGLSGLTVKAGVRSAIGTLWSTEDDPTYRLMQQFYAAFIRNGKTKAQALQFAQLNLLKRPINRYKHPATWAPFVLVGNWL